MPALADKVATFFCLQRNKQRNKHYLFANANTAEIDLDSKCRLKQTDKTKTTKFV